jgi:hypothetical protein
LIETLAPSPTILPVSAPVEGQAATPQESPAPTPEQNALIGDLHWLIHQGHVIEFANGTLETAKKPVPKPPKPAARKEEKAAAAPGEPVSTETSEATSDSTPAEVTAAEGETNSNHAEIPEAAPAAVADESGHGTPNAEIESIEQPETDPEKQSTPPLDQGSNPPPVVVSATPPAPVESPS